MMIIYISLDRRKSQMAIYIYFFTSNIRTIGCTHQDKRMNAWSASKHLQKAVMVSSMPDTRRRQVICNENLFHVWIGVAYLDQENTWYTLTWATQVTRTVIILFLWEEGTGPANGLVGSGSSDMDVSLAKHVNPNHFDYWTIASWKEYHER